MIILDCTGRDLQRPDQPRLTLLLAALLTLSLAALLAWPPSETVSTTPPPSAPTSVAIPASQASPRVTLVIAPLPSQRSDHERTMPATPIAPRATLLVVAL